VKRLSDTLTYRGIASEAVFTVSPVVGEFGPPYYPYLRCISTAMASLQSIATRHHRCRAHVHCVQPYGINNYNWVRRRASQPARPDSLRRFDDVKCSATSEWLLTASKLKRRSHCCKLCSAAQYCGQHVCVYMQIKCSKYHAKWRRKTTSAIWRLITGSSLAAARVRWNGMSETKKETRKTILDSRRD